MKRIASFVAVLVSASALGGGLAAQEFSGTLETGLGWSWTQDQIQSADLSFQGKVSGKIGPEDMPAAQYSAAATLALDPLTMTTALSLDEAWIKVFLGPIDLSVGNQIIAWGSTDGFSPADVVNPKDLSLPVDPAKIPVPLVRGILNADWFTLDLAVQPIWVASVLPGTDWTATALPAGVTLSPTLTTTDNPVALNWEHLQFGGRAKASIDLLQGLDLAATVWHGYTTIPTASYDLDLSGYPVIAISNINLDYEPYNLMAVEGLFALGEGFILKTEWGYTVYNDSPILEPEAGDAKVQGVSGLEFSLGPVKFVAEYVYDWAKGDEGADDTEAHTILAVATWDIEGVANLQVTAMHDFDSSGVIAPELSCTIADGLKVVLKAFIFYGESDTSYGQWSDNSLGQVSLKYSF